ncbi:MAG TPA: Rrf2 family transcriptional regulator, partial [Rectinemataceae bacterium]
MRTTMRGFYALRALAVLAAQTAPARPLALRKIAEEEGISMEFLQQIFFRLRKAGLIAASRGPGGGFYLARPAEKISVLEALDAAGECLALVPRDGEIGKGGENPDSGKIG